MLPSLLGWALGSVLAAAASAGADGSPIRVPYERVASGHVIVQISVEGGAPVPFAVDSGASVSVLAPDTWRAAGHDPDRGLKLRGKGAGGNLDAARLAMGVDVTLAGQPVTVGAAVVLPLPEGVTGEVALGGILGRDVLRRYVVELDESRHLLTLHPRRTALDATGMVILPMRRLRAGLTSVTIGLGAHTAEAVVDFGAGVSVLNAAAVALPGVEREADCGGTVVGADRQQMDLSCLNVPDVVLGGTHLGPRRMHGSDLPIFSVLRLANAPALILGNDVYAGRRLVLDDGRRELWISADVVTGAGATPEGVNAVVVDPVEAGG